MSETWYPKNGFYQVRSGRGDNPWSAEAQFDAIECPSVEVTETDTAVSWGELTAPLTDSGGAFREMHPPVAGGG